MRTSERPGDPAALPDPSPEPAAGAAGTGRRWPVAVVAVLLLGQMGVAMVLGARGDAPTFDEPAHLAAGIGYLRYQQLRLNYEHPPLVKALAAVAPLLAHVKVPPAQTFATAEQSVVGREILYGRGNDPRRVMLLARLPMIALALALALAVFGFATDLFGARAALLPLALVSVDPNLLAHGRLVTTDVPVTLFTLLAVWMLWRSGRRGRLGWLALAGVAFGLALASKYSAVILVPVVGLLALVAGARAWRGRRGLAVLAALGAPLLVMALAVGCVWALYLAIDPALRFTPRVIEGGGLAGLIADHLPLPVPYRSGLRFVIYYDQIQRPAFLLGEHYQGGRRLFYPAVLAIKTPLGTLAAWALAALALLATLARRRLDVLFVVGPPAWMLAVAMASGTNIGIRHILLVPVFAAVATGALAAWRTPGPAQRGTDGLVRRQGRPVGAVVGVVLALVAGASVWRAFPSDLAYVNEAFGGPDRGYRLVGDSNLDWGQDLDRAAAWVRAHPSGEPVYLLYFGTAEPAAYGLDAIDLRPGTIPREQVHGTVLASASYLSIYARPQFAWLDDLEPVDQIGHSILVYRVP